MKISGFMNRLSIVTKNMMLTSLSVLMTGVILITASYYIQGAVLTNQLEENSQRVMEAWKDKISPEDAKAAMTDTDRNSELQKKLTKLFDELSATHPEVAQGYIFGAKVENHSTQMIAFSTDILDMFEGENLFLGDMLGQPAYHVKGVEEMLKTKQITFTKPYKDDYGIWLTVLYPVQDKSGQVFSYIGMDFDASLILTGQRDLLRYTVLSLIVILIVILSFQFFTTRRTFAPVKDLMAGLDKLSKNDFSVRLKTDESELGQVNAIFNKMAQNMNDLVSTIKTVSIQSADQSKILFDTLEENHQTSAAIGANIEEISEKASRQSKAIAESVTSLEEINSGVGTVANSTAALSDASMQMKDRSEVGRDNIGGVIEQMDAIQQSVQQSVVSIEQLQKRSGQIEEIVRVITQIAEQTHLLSLNASIEAARAGEEGRGFAVVANQVKKLAEESAKSADQIADLVHFIQKETLTAVAAISEGDRNVTEGIQIVQKTGELFGTILDANDAFTSQIQEVSAATEEMVAETEQITATIKQIAEYAEQNAVISGQIQESATEQRASADNIMNTAEHLNEISGSLEKLVKGLTL